jgi:hypothetical protein
MKELLDAGGTPLTIAALSAAVVLLLALIVLALHNRRLQAALAVQAPGAAPASGLPEAPPPAA